MLIVKLFYKLIELFLGRSDLVREQIGTFLQVNADVTHVTPPFAPSHGVKLPMRMVVPANWGRLKIAKRCDFWATHREAHVKGDGDLRRSLELFDLASAIKSANQIANQPRSTARYRTTQASIIASEMPNQSIRLATAQYGST